MKNDNYNSRHSKADSAQAQHTNKNKNFTVNIDEKLLKVGDEFEDDNIDYNIEDFVDTPATERRVHSQRRERPKSNGYDDINSFSNDGVKNNAQKKTQKEGKKQYKTFKKEQKQKNRNNRKIFRMFWLVACLVVGVVLAQFLLVGFNDFLAVNREDATTAKIELAENPDIDTVASELKEGGVISSEFYFKLFAKVTKSEDSFRQGTFEIGKNLDYQAIISFLESNSNRTDIVTVQFYDGMNIVEIANKLKENGVITNVDNFLRLCNSNEFDERFTFLKGTENDTKYYKLEGYMYPDTYDFYINEDPSTVIEKFINNYENRIYYEKRAISGSNTPAEIGKLLQNETEYTNDEIMIMASIIQAEALNKEDMYYISSILHNRLDEGYDSGVANLSCDSTIYYPYRTKSSLPENLSSYVSRYDTYSVVGLPAGEICNPGADAILAALQPYDTDYLYFCHSASTDEKAGQPYYATNIWDHEYNLELAGLTNDGE